MTSLVPDLSVIFGTYNRLPLLQQAVESVRVAVGDLSYEIVLTDGGSTDGTLPWIAAQPDIVLAETGNLRGAVSAFNAAWAASRGQYVANFNDDAEYLGKALHDCVLALQADPSIGQVAMEFDAFGHWHYDHMLDTGILYANYGVSRRSVVEKVCAAQGGPRCYWSKLYRTYAADCEHSAWILAQGLKVQAVPHKVHDFHAGDGLRQRNLNVYYKDLYTFKNRLPMLQEVIAKGVK